MPRSFRWRTRSRISPTAIGSMPASGSSSRMKDGCVASARAISTRRRSPPESAMAGALRRWVMPNSASNSSTMASRRPCIGFDQFRGRADVFLDRQPAEDRGFLRQIADAEARAAIHRQLRDVVTVELDRAVIGRDEAGDHVEAGGLAGAVGAQQAHHLAAPKRQAHRAHDGALAEAFADAMDDETLAALDQARQRPAGGVAPVFGLMFRVGRQCHGKNCAYLGFKEL